MRLAGKTAIVTGAASGFGLGIAEKFLAEGAKVLMADINGEAVADQASRLGKLAIAMRADVASSASIAQMHDAAQTALGRGRYHREQCGRYAFTQPVRRRQRKRF